MVVCRGPVFFGGRSRVLGELSRSLGGGGSRVWAVSGRFRRLIGHTGRGSSNPGVQVARTLPLLLEIKTTTHGPISFLVTGEYLSWESVCRGRKSSA